MNKNELLKVMIVDDEEMIRRGLRAIVDWKEYGYTVCCDAADGEDGYQKALVYQPDLIITDIKMPIADGLQMMTKLRENCFETEFILLTGYAEFEYAQKALQLGAKSYILKPIDEEELVKTLIEAREEILQRRKENFHNKYFSISMEQVITKLVYGAVDEEFIDAANAVYGFQLPWKRYQLVLLEQTKNQETDEKVLDLLKDFTKNNIGFVFSLNNHFVVLTKDVIFEQGKMRLLEDLNGKLRKLPGYTQPMVVSRPLKELEQINQAYYAASYFIEHQFIFPYEEIVLIDEVGNPYAQGKISNANQREQLDYRKIAEGLCVAVCGNDLTGISSLLENLGNKCVESGYDLEQIRIRYVSTYVSVMYLLKIQSEEIFKQEGMVDVVMVAAGGVIPGDGEVIEGIASVDESAITGESAPVVREAGGDFSSVTGGTTVVSDWLKVRITSDPGDSFLDRMIALVEGASRKKTPNEIALNTLLVSLTVIFLIVIVTLYPIALYSGVQLQTSTLIALMVCLIPTTIGGLLSAIGIAGMDRMTRFNVIAMSGKAVEACGDVDTMILDKTGTITYGNRLAADFFPVGGACREELVRCAALTSLHDGTPEGKSTLALARLQGEDCGEPQGARFIAFTAQTRMSGVDLPGGRSVRKGASDAIEKYVSEMGGKVPEGLARRVAEVSALGGTPLAVCEDSRILGVIYLKDTVKAGMAERFKRLRAIGIKTIMCTGDNPLTAATIAKEAGVDGFIAECKPEDKIALIKKEQAEGKIVAMTGDGTNDAPALAQANVGLAMNSGTAAAKEAANMVDLDSDPTKILEVVEIGKQLLITRGSLTTFSIANDIAKYFAIIPAMFMMAIPQLGVLNIMDLATPHSAILSALIFNAIIIPCLIPLALRGVKYRPMSSGRMLARNMMLYGLGGVIAPFAGIKLIDMLIHPLLALWGF